jgi:hypothetical protein
VEDLCGEAPLADPADFTGGGAHLTFAGEPGEGGCVVFVRDGRVTLLEGYTYGRAAWPEDAAVVFVSNVEPIDPAAT